jgi:hypothetical protein
MRQLLKLSKILKELGLNKESDLAINLFKQAFVNDAYIRITPDYESVKVELMGAAGAEVVSYGHVDMMKFDGVESEFNYSDYYQVHSNIREEIKSLGYGRDLYLSAIKWATEQGSAVISGPWIGSTKSDDAIKVNESLSQTPGVSSQDVYLVSDEYEYGSYDEETDEEDYHDGSKMMIFDPNSEKGSALWAKAKPSAEKAKRDYEHYAYEDGFDIRKHTVSFEDEERTDTSYTRHYYQFAVGKLHVASGETKLPISLPTKVDWKKFEDKLSDNPQEKEDFRWRHTKTLEEIRRMTPEEYRQYYEETNPEGYAREQQEKREFDAKQKRLQEIDEIRNPEKYQDGAWPHDYPPPL